MSMPVKTWYKIVPPGGTALIILLERTVETRWPISAVLSDEKVTKRSDRYLDLKNEQWELAKLLLGPLQQIDTATVYFSEVENFYLFPLCYLFYLESWIISKLQMKTVTLSRNLNKQLLNQFEED